MPALKAADRHARSTGGQPGLRARVSDEADGRWFAGEVIGVQDDPAGNVTVRLRPDSISRQGRLPLYPQEEGSEWRFLLVLSLVAHALLWLLRLVLD